MMTPEILKQMRLALLIMYMVLFFVIPQRLKLTGDIYVVGPFIVLCIIYLIFDHSVKKNSRQIVR